MTLKPDAQTEQPLRDHLQEFRKRLIICLVVVAIAALACYNYVDDIIALLSGPAGKLYFMNPSEVFFTYMEIALYTGILFTLPVLRGAGPVAGGETGRFGYIADGSYFILRRSCFCLLFGHSCSGDLLYGVCDADTSTHVLAGIISFLYFGLDITLRVHF